MFRRISTAALALTLALSFTACSSKAGEPSSTSEATGETRTKVRIGVVGENNEQWVAAGELLKEKGMDIELVRLRDYSLPDQTLSDVEIELY